MPPTSDDLMELPPHTATQRMLQLQRPRADEAIHKSLANCTAPRMEAPEKEGVTGD